MGWKIIYHPLIVALIFIKLSKLLSVELSNAKLIKLQS